MPLNQRTLARHAGVSQTAVSLALRNHPSIPAATRQRIQQLAESQGYRTNPNVASLMAQIRRNRRSETIGDCIALVVDAANQAGWLDREYCQRQYDGMTARAAELGFRAEPFFLRAQGMTVARLDNILHARGIRSLVLAGPKRSPIDLSAMRWQDYACATISYTWDWPPVDRISSHHRHNMDTVLHQLHARGYQRIGLSLQPHEVEAVDQNWLSGVLVMNQRLPARRRISLFVGQQNAATLPAFARWLEKHKPDALVTLTGWEETWLRRLGLRTPSDIGHACVNRPGKTRVAGIEEDHAMIGSTTIELLVAQMHRNEYGLPRRPRLTLINGEWREGSTLRPAAP
ncbi:LacI family transcriptional regulator [Opitutaceae bacterium TAV4]|nr:LacI family transcriptional regulator [Opitutaceae bacterium TAV4]RRK00115.1 LacI family transcriptional regulator [Opitutaceae bacterium TAV3]